MGAVEVGTWDVGQGAAVAMKVCGVTARRTVHAQIRKVSGRAFRLFHRPH